MRKNISIFISILCACFVFICTYLNMTPVIGQNRLNLKKNEQQPGDQRSDVVQRPSIPASIVEDITGYLDVDDFDIKDDRTDAQTNADFAVDSSKDVIGIRNWVVNNKQAEDTVLKAGHRRFRVQDVIDEDGGIKQRGNVEDNVLMHKDDSHIETVNADNEIVAKSEKLVESEEETGLKSDEFTEEDAEVSNEEKDKGRPMCSTQTRLEEIKKKCETKYPELSKGTSFLRHIKVDDKHKVLLCLVRKAASTSIHNLMHYMLTGKYHPDPNNCGEECWEKVGVKRLHTFSKEEQEYRINNYHKIMVVRHPFDRFVSCWVNKFKRPGSSLHQRNSGYELLKYVRNISLDDFDYNAKIKYWMTPTEVSNLEKPEWLQKEMDKEMTLSEVAQLIDHYTKTEPYQNSHWREMYQVCQPCYIKYDYMVRVETLSRDSQHIIKALNVTGETFPLANTGKGRDPHKAFDTILPDFSSVPPKVMETLENMYKIDLDLFGYGWKRDTYAATCNGYHEHGEDCC